MNASLIRLPLAKSFGPKRSNIILKQHVRSLVHRTMSNNKKQREFRSLLSSRKAIPRGPRNVGKDLQPLNGDEWAHLSDLI